jgi:hypothetical protein
MSRAGGQGDPVAARPSGTAGSVGLALLLAAMAGAAWVSAGAIPGRSNGGGLVEGADLLAAVPCAIAAIEAVLLFRAKTTPARAIGWFVVACAGLLVVVFVAAISNSGLGS